MEYTIFQDNDSDTLAQQVQKAIAQGWKPLGGIAVGVGEQNSLIYVQAMILESK